MADPDRKRANQQHYLQTKIENIIEAELPRILGEDQFLLLMRNIQLPDEELNELVNVSSAMIDAARWLNKHGDKSRWL